MDTRVFSVYNLARGALLNSTLRMADSAHQPLKLLDQLISGLGLGSQSGLWLLPISSPPLIPRVFPYDFIYLDQDYKVLHAAEIGPGVNFPPHEPSAVSALILPSGMIFTSKTAPGDRLLICPAEELETRIAASESANPATASPIPPSPGRPAVPRSTRKKSAAATPEPGSAATISLPVLGSSAPATGQSAEPRPSPLNGAPVARTSSRTLNKTPFEEAIQKALAAKPPQNSTLQLMPASTEPEDSSVLTKTNEAVPAVEDQRTAAQPSSEPPISITEVVLNHPRPVQAAIVEHHTDPEDLFSNWVVSPSAAPAWVIDNGFDPPASSRAVTRAPQSAPAPRPEPVQLSAQAESKTPPVPPATLTSAPDTRAAVEPGAATPPVLSSIPPIPAPSSPARQKSAASIPAPQKLPPGLGVAQISASTTFSATQYSMWQISTPTAVAPPSPVMPSSSRNTVAPNASQTPATSGIVGSKSAPAQTEHTIAEPGETPARRPSPAQFVSSMQQRIERLQNLAPGVAPSKPTTPAQLIRPAAEIPRSPQTKTSPSPTPNQDDIKATPADVTAAAYADPPPTPAPTPSPQSPAAHAETLGKPEPPRSTLKSRFRQWLKPTAAPSDRRRAIRRYVPGMVAHYFTGGAPKPHSIADISMTGFYLLTEDRWMPGTMIQMTLQKPTSKGDRKQSITVLSRVVRRGSDGVATEFVLPGTLDPYSHDVPASQATDKFALARFL